MPEPSTQTAYFALLDALPTPVWVSDPGGATLFVNAALTGLLHSDAGQGGIEDVLAFVHPETRASETGLWPRTWQDAEAAERDVRVRAWGEYRWHRAHTRAAVGAQGEPVLVTTLTRLDAASEGGGRGTSEVEHGPAQERAGGQGALDHVPVGLARVALEDARFLEVNDALCALLGAPREALLGAPWLAFVETESPDVDLKRFRQLAAGEAGRFTVERRVLNAPGGVWVQLTVSLVERQGHPAYGLCVVHDVSERRAAEEALAESETRFRALAEGIREVFYVHELDEARISYVSPAYETVWARPRAELYAGLTSFVQTVHPDDRPLLFAAMDRQRAGEDTQTTYRLHFEDGTGRVIFDRAFVTRDARTGARRVVGIAEDVTTFKVTEAALQASADTFRHLVRSNPFGVYVVDADFRLTEVSRGAQQVFENVRPLLGRDFAEVLRVVWPEPFASTVTGIFRRTLATGEPYESPRTVERRGDIDASEAYDWRIERLTLPDGRFGIVCYFYDLSERLAWEAQLQASEARLSAVLDALPVGVVIADETGRLIRDNATHRDLWGLPPETTDWAQYSQWKGWWPETGARIEADGWAMTRALLHGETVQGELVQYEPFNGEGRRFFLNNAAPIRDASGRIIGGVVAEQDVTERLLAERAVRENAERVQLALSAGAILGTWLWDLPADRFTVDEGFAVNFGLDAALGREGLSLEQIIATVHPDDRDGLLAAIGDAVKRGGRYAHEYRVRRRDGQYYWIEANGRVECAEDGTPRSFPGVLLDAEERRTLQAAVRASEERLRLATQAAQIGTWDYDLLTDTLQWDARTKSLFGLPADAGVTYDGAFLPALHPEDRARTEAAVRAALAPGGPGEYDIEYRTVGLDDGTERWLAARGRAFFEAGRAVRFVGTVIDLTERKAMEAALREYGETLERRVEERTVDVRSWRERFEVAVRASGHLVYDWDLTTNAVVYGGNVEAITGYRVDELRGHLTDWTGRLVHPDDHAAFEAELARVLDEGQEFHLAFRLLRKDGMERFVEDDGSLLYASDGSARLIGFVKDVTERHEAASALVQANEALRRSNTELERFAYIASHDLQEPIRTVASFVGLLEKRYGQALDDRGRLYVDTALKGVQRMKALVDDLLTYSRLQGGEARRRPVDMDSPLSEALARLERRLEESGAHVTWDDLPVVLGDGPQLAQLLQNLIGNAVKFVPEGVRPEVHLHAAREGDFWHFRLTDNGIGIEDGYLERIFELFQRLHTREKFEGTGLGLGICQKIVDQHGGRIWAASQVNQGSTFHFTLPAAPDR